ncbi:MAG TPA: protein phosphatase 2C domain-containing protein [Ktedonobacteraceae bacterium]|nr:protein phosphatase 2C domain-containing protein [Ktedonobacteraceae bacterium]
MSTHSLNIPMQRGIGLPVRLVLGAVLVLTALLLALPASAFAFVSSSTLATDPAQNVAQAGVSVVRIVVTYIATGNTPSPKGTALPLPGGSKLQCTGLGALVSSSTPSGDATAKNVWVLTDGSLLNPDKMTCGTSNTSVPASVQLSQIQVFVSNEYTNTKPNNALIGTLAVKTGDVTCENTANCNQGLALFGFSSPALQPYFNLAQSSITSVAQEQGIELMNTSATAASAPPTVLDAQQSLSPQAVSLTSTFVEPGMPIVDKTGSLVSMHLTGSGTAPTITTITDLMASVPALNTHPANLLHDNWDSGIQAYYVAHNYAVARSDFQKATTANQQFVAGTTFAALAAAKLQSSGSAGNKGSETASSAPANKGSNAFLSSPLLLGSIVALVVLVVILVVATLFLKRRSGLARFNQEEKSAQRKAEKDAQYIASMESQQRQGQGAGWPNPPPPVVTAQAGAPTMNASNGQMPSSAAPTAPMSPGAPLPPAAPVPPQMSPVVPQMSPVREAPCPHCGTVIPTTSQHCPKCHTWLSPSASGLRLQVNPQQQGMPVDMEATRPFSPQPSAPPSPYAIENQPTLVPLPPNQPGNGLEDTEKTIPYNIRQAGNGRLGLVVGTRTDRGIKRKHKPNEDSLFAAQGEGMFNASPQPFGFFVVADGMGGHANGQDASRLAIQTIINHMLPLLSKGENLDREALKNLLVEGVQRANEAVFQHNMEQRADMGTTMTSALVVGSTAIVANVGDSRTYLYREPEGLRKITNDHSVVASLVEAGIIKPDDIYTHPKRNQIYRSLGEKPAVEVDSFFVDLIPGDELLLCSDGLWDMVRDPNILQVVRNAAHNPDQTGDALIQAALDGGGEDNVSVIIVSITDNDQYTGITGINLLAKPETVQMPQL